MLQSPRGKPNKTLVCWFFLFFPSNLWAPLLRLKWRRAQRFVLVIRVMKKTKDDTLTRETFGKLKHVQHERKKRWIKNEMMDRKSVKKWNWFFFFCFIIYLSVALRDHSRKYGLANEIEIYWKYYVINRFKISKKIKETC